MYPKKIRNQKLIVAILLALTAMLTTISIATATLADINTNNGTNTEWASVPLFQTDSAGDVNTSCTGFDGRDDIIEVKVASGPASGPVDKIYFNVTLNSTLSAAVQLHQISAYLDCTPAGADNADANVLYRPFPDQLVLGNGVLPNPDVKLFANNGTDGERYNAPTTNNYTLEWGIDIDEFINWNVGSQGSLNCGKNSQPQIIIRTLKVLSGSGAYDCTYDETYFRGFNIPTLVKLANLEANPKPDNLVLKSISIISLASAISIGFIGFNVFRKNKKQN